MFRYIAFSWTASAADQAQFAQRLDQELCARAGWRKAFRMPGHHVYTIGSVRGINDVYPLPTKQGVILGRLFRRRGLTHSQKRDLELDEPEARRIVETDGRALVEQFWGRYVAFLPSWTGQARVLRDPTGTLPCYHIEIHGVAIVFSWLEDLTSLSGFHMPSASWDAVGAYLLFGQIGGSVTALEGITQVMPGELTWMTSGGPAPVRLWSAVDVARDPSKASREEASQQLHDTVLTCVQSWASCYDSLVLRLSGGVDSAILLSALSPAVQPHQVTCVNHHSPGEDSDERVYARLAARRAGVNLLERGLDLGFRLEDIMGVACTPVPVNYIGGMGTDSADAEIAAATKAGAVFTGAAGDQLFFEFRCTWPAADYLRLRGIDRGFLSTTLDAAHLGRVSFWNALHRAFADRAFRGDPLKAGGRFSTLVPPEAMAAFAKTAHRFVHPGSFEAADLPIGKFNQLSALICPVEYYNHHLREAAPELVHPLLSQPLLELSLATPTYLLTYGGRGRALARDTFASHIPPEIAARKSKGAASQFATEVLKRNLPFAREMLLDGKLAKQGLLDLQRVELALCGRPSSNARVGEVHACIAAEAWLRRVRAD